MEGCIYRWMGQMIDEIDWMAGEMDKYIDT